MVASRPRWTSSLVGVVPALRRIVEDEDLNGLTDRDRCLMGFLAEDLEVEVSDLRAVSRFYPGAATNEDQSDLPRAVVAAARAVGETDVDARTDDVPALLEKLARLLGALAVGSAVTWVEVDHLLSVLDAAGDVVFGTVAQV
jgi:hypothetical protein